jgi:hypothetical protein
METPAKVKGRDISDHDVRRIGLQWAPLKYLLRLK